MFCLYFFGLIQKKTPIQKWEIQIPQGPISQKHKGPKFSHNYSRIPKLRTSLDICFFFFLIPFLLELHFLIGTMHRSKLLIIQSFNLFPQNFLFLLSNNHIQDPKDHTTPFLTHFYQRLLFLNLPVHSHIFQLLKAV